MHNDYTVKSGPQRVRDLMGAEAGDLLNGRFAVINVWRPIRGVVEEKPLALCDARSVAPQDWVATDLLYPDRTGEIYYVAHNPAQRWFYFPDMTREEAVLLKCYDSATDGRARFSPHTAFADPTSPANARPRESIEVRTLVFFEEQRSERKAGRQSQRTNREQPIVASRPATDRPRTRSVCRLAEFVLDGAPAAACLFLLWSNRDTCARIAPGREHRPGRTITWQNIASCRWMAAAPGR